MKTIGVITHWGSLDNYGQTLQTYALQKVLESLGYDSFLIRYLEDGIRRSILQKCYSALNPRYLINYFRYRKLNKKDFNNNILHGRDLRKFLDKHIKQAPLIYSRQNLLENPPIADIYITGSDQVWNKLDRSYFLDFVKGKKISYAASFGGTTYSEPERKVLFDLLDSFDHISVRELSGRKICEQIGILDVKVVPDPTILLRRKDYLELSINPSFDKPYILIYMLGNKVDFDLKECFDFAQANSLEVKYVAGQRQSDNYPKIYPSMEEWLGLIANAKFVITNSFHGTVMSTILNVPFISIPLAGSNSKMNSRIETFLSNFGLDKRLTKNIESISDTIDYNAVNLRLKVLQNSGIECLDNMIRN